MTGDAAQFKQDYDSKHYHQASDHYYEWWDMSAMIQTAELGLALGMKLANAPALPRYNRNDEFFAADKRRIKG